MTEPLAPTLTFAGGAGTVTGSKYLVQAAGRRVLLDCGLFQGLKALRLRNWAPPPFDPRSIDAVVLSHGHLDHSGALPLLARGGFAGPVHCSSATADLLGVVLRDAAHVQEDDAARANRHHYSKHEPALPLYTLADAEAALALVSPRPSGASFAVAPGLDVVLRRSGHILGASTVELNVGGPSPVRLVFSGDLGRWDRPILKDPERVESADVLLLESTYGDRLHPGNADEQLREVISQTVRRGGVVVVPAFAIGRTQELLWRIQLLREKGMLPLVGLFVDSPMASAVNQVYCRHPEEHDHEMAERTHHGKCPLCSPSAQLVRTAEESKALNRHHGSAVIIAGSGMATGGRVLHHLKYRLPDPRNTVLLSGFQAEGTRGRALQEGARHLRIHGEDVQVRARVETIEGLSAHADQGELLRWLSGFTRPPRQTFLVHGEPKASEALAGKIRERLGWNVAVAADGATVSLAAAGQG